MTIVKFKPLEEPLSHSSYVTSDGRWAAIPYGDSQYIIINDGMQVHLSYSLETAKSYIHKQLRKKVK